MATAETISGEIIATFEPKDGRPDRALLATSEGVYALVQRDAPGGGWRMLGRRAAFGDAILTAESILWGDERKRTDPHALAQVCLALVGLSMQGAKLARTRQAEQGEAP